MTLDSLPAETITGLRDRALIGVLVYTFARIGAAVALNVEDIYSQNRRLWVRLHEKGGKQHVMPAPVAYPCGEILSAIRHPP